MLFRRQFDPESLPYIYPAKSRRVALITAGNSGVGWYTAFHLYLHGYVVYLAGRSKARCLDLIRKIVHEAATVAAAYTPEQRASRACGELHYLELDLASLASVLRATGTFSRLEDHLNVLVNNADVTALAYTETPDGFDVQLQANYVAPFLLTTRLLPLLERTANIYPEDGPPRVVYTSLVAHRFVLRNFSLGTCWNCRPNFLFAWVRYLVAKTAGIHFVRMLALRNPRVLCMSADPGLVMDTNHFSSWTRLPLVGVLFWFLFEIFGFFFGVTVEQGAHAIVKCSLDPEITLEEDSGGHFAGSTRTESSRVARNMDYAAQSWIWTIHQLGKRHIDIV